MTELIKTYHHEFEAFVASHPKGHFCQSFLWSGVKDAWVWRGIICRDDQGVITGTMAVLIRKLPYLPYTLLYAPRGPVCDSTDQSTLRQLLEAVDRLAKEFNAYKFTIDPDIPGPCPVLQIALCNWGAQLKPPASEFSNIQPQYVVRLSLAGKTSEQILSQMQGKTRYNLRLAQRKGVTVHQCGPEALPDFYQMMVETGQRDGFGIRSQAYFSKLLEQLGPHARLYMAYWENQPIAGTIAVGFGDKVWYLYGVSSNRHRNVMPNYLLQWTMIQWAVAQGCRLYDFRGIPAALDDTNGLWRFKRGWGGQRVEFIGEFEKCYIPLVSRLVDFGYGLIHRRPSHRSIK
jgi:peptidoglycan pentaglycine glycine transferase (the first glycine)